MKARVTSYLIRAFLTATGPVEATSTSDHTQRAERGARVGWGGGTEQASVKRKGGPDH